MQKIDAESKSVVHAVSEIKMDLMMNLRKYHKRWKKI